MAAVVRLSVMVTRYAGKVVYLFIHLMKCIDIVKITIDCELAHEAAKNEAIAVFRYQCESRAYVFTGHKLKTVKQLRYGQGKGGKD